jgi:murein tripeptide amidase MpaA
MNGITVEIGGKSYPLRWEVGSVKEFETLHPSFNGAPVAWQTSSFQSSPLFALWAMSLRCNGVKITEADALELLQAYLDEGHTIEDARELVGEAGAAGHFLAIIEPDAEDEVEASPLTPEDGTTAPSK